MFIFVFISLVCSSVISFFRKATIVTSFSTSSVKLFTFCDSIRDNATTISVIVIQEIDANDSEKFLNTLLNESLMFRVNILNYNFLPK